MKGLRCYAPRFGYWRFRIGVPARTSRRHQTARASLMRMSPLRVPASLRPRWAAWPTVAVEVGAFLRGPVDRSSRHLHAVDTLQWTHDTVARRFAGDRCAYEGRFIETKTATPESFDVCRQWRPIDPSVGTSRRPAMPTVARSQCRI